MKNKWYHLAFVAVVVTVLVVLKLAPDVKTARLPRDADHKNRKAFATCPGCHGPESKSPMPPDHLAPGAILRPDHAKCYFCHKPKDQ